jgi:hypothetical protein
MKRRSVRCLICLVALEWVACSNDAEPNPACQVLCDNSVTFALATPLSGGELAISVGFPNGTEQSIDCQPGGGSVTCAPVNPAIVPSFAANGALESVRVRGAPTGGYTVQIVVDGTAAAAQSFSYQPANDPTSACGACPLSQTFTIAN